MMLENQIWIMSWPENFLSRCIENRYRIIKKFLQLIVVAGQFEGEGGNYVIYVII